MVPEKNESANEVGSISANAHSTDDSGVSLDQGDAAAQTGHKLKRRRLFLIGMLAALGLAIAVVFGVPSIKRTLSTVSTDDAYVNGHVTFVAARVPGQVSRVLVDDNKRVRKGDFLVELDKEPYEVAVAVKKLASIRQRRTSRRQEPWCVDLKHRPEAGAGGFSTLWRTSKTRSRYFTRRLRVLIRIGPR